MIKPTLALFSLLLLCGCIPDKAPNADAPAGAKGQASDDDTDKPKREQCEHTMEGNEAKTFCY